MAIEFSCGNCSAKFRVVEKMAGKKIRCPKCQTIEQVPGGQPEPEEQYEVEGGEEDFWSQTAGQTLPSESNLFESPVAVSGTPSKKGKRGVSPLQRVQIPGMVLLTMTVLGVVMEIAAAIFFISIGEFSMPRFGFGGLLGLACIYYTFTGLLSFVRLDDRYAAQTGLVLAMLPCGTSLLCFIAIPFAIWGMALMNDKQIQASFHS